MATSQGPVLFPKEKLSAVEEALLSSTRDPKSGVSFDDRVGTVGEQDRRASSKASELEISVTELRKLAKDNSVTTTKPSIGRRVLRTVIGFFIAASIGVGATVAWQPHGDAASKIIPDWAVTSLSSLSSALTAKSPSHVDVAAEQTLPTVAFQASANETAPLQPAPYPQAPSLPALAAPSAELAEQVQTVARNLDALRRNVAELAAKQEKMSLNIAKLQAADKEIRQKLAAPRKTAPIASQQTVAQVSSARTPPQATAQSNTQSPSAQSLSQARSEGRPAPVTRPVLRED